MVYSCMKYLALAIALRSCFVFTCRCRKFKPDWQDLDTRLLPRWYDEAKVGIFIHWGVYSVPAVDSEWFWRRSKQYNSEAWKFMEKQPNGFTYKDFAPMFRAEMFDPDNWALLFKNAGANLSQTGAVCGGGHGGGQLYTMEDLGMIQTDAGNFVLTATAPATATAPVWERLNYWGGWWARTMRFRYVVLTSKHHDGYTLFLSKRTRGWNSVDVGPKRDLVEAVAEAVRAKDMKFGIYYSLFEWFHPLYLKDKRNRFRTKEYSKSIWPEIKYVMYAYKPSVFWSDGDWEATDEYWNAVDSLAWFYNESPTKDEIVVNDRWGNNIKNMHCDVFTGGDRYNPGRLLEHKFENAFTIDKFSWGYRKDMDKNVMTIQELLYQVVTTVSYGGNVLINVGPTKEGIIVPVFRERLLALGTWLAINGEAIYGSSPWMHQQDTASPVWYTCTRKQYNITHPMTPPKNNNEVKAIYAIFLTWPTENVLRLKNVRSLMKDGYTVNILGDEYFNINWEIINDEVQFSLPNEANLKSKNAWSLKFFKLHFH